MKVQQRLIEMKIPRLSIEYIKGQRGEEKKMIKIYENFLTNPTNRYQIEKIKGFHKKS